MRSKKSWVFLPLLLVGIMAGFYLSFLNVGGAKADGVNLTVDPSVAGTDNLAGASSASWVFTATTTADLAANDVVQFIFPTSSAFDISGATVTASSGVSLYTDPGTSATNILSANPSFESATTSWTDLNVLLGGSSVHDVTTTAHSGDYALALSHSGSTSGAFVMNYPYSGGYMTSTVDTNYTASFYARGVDGGEHARFLLGGNGISCPDMGYVFLYNFVSSTWSCQNLMDASTFASTSEYVSTTVMTTDFVRITTTFDSSSSTQLAFYLYTGSGSGDTSFNEETVIYDAVQMEEGPSVSVFNLGESTPAVEGVGISSNVIYGFVNNTFGTGGAVSFTFDGITNPTGTLTTLQDMDFSIKGGTPTDSEAPGGSLSSTKFSITDTETVTRSGSTITSDDNADISATSYLASTTSVDYTFVFTASTSIPVGGKIVLNFPSGFDLDGSSVSTLSNINGVTISSNTLTTNNDFESGFTGGEPDDWIVTTHGAPGSGTVFSEETTLVHGGGSALKIDNGDTSLRKSVMNSVTGLTLGDSYDIKYWASRGDDGELTLLVLDKAVGYNNAWNFTSGDWESFSGAPGEGQSYTISSSTLTADYQQFSTANANNTPSVPESEELAVLFMAGINVGVIYLDDVTVEASGGGTPAQVASGAIATTTNSITLTTSNAATVVGDTITVSVSGVTNPDISDADTGDAYNTFWVYTLNASDGLLDGSYSVDDYGTAPYLDSITILPSAPSQPSIPTATAVSTSQINLSWTATDNTTYYHVYRSIDNTTFTSIATTTAVSYSDTGLTAATVYYYKIAGVNAGGTATQSISVTATTESVAVVSSSGGGSSTPAPVSVGLGSNTQQVGMNATKNAGPITGSTNAVVYIGSELGFSVGGQSHNMNVTNLDMANRIVELEFHSEVVKVKLAVGDTELLDLDSDGINDLKVKFNDLVSNRIDLTITNLDESATIVETAKTTVTTKPVANKYNFTSYLYIGNSGQEVKDLQTLLKGLGYFTYPAITGYFGNVTKSAVVAYQKAEGLIPFPGWTGPATRKALNSEGAVTQTKIEAKVEEVKTTGLGNYGFKSYLYIGNTGQEVKDLQVLLKDLGYFTYPTITGYFGNVTKQAVIDFQKAKGLSPFPGWVGPGTRSALNSL